MSARKDKRQLHIAFGSICFLYALSLAASLVFLAMGDPKWNDDLAFSLMTFLFPLVGFLICRRQPRNVIGWLLLAIGFAWVAPAIPDLYGHYALFTRPGSLPGGVVAEALISWSWVPPVGIMGTYLLLLFPNGRLLSPRWRIVGWLSAISMVIASLGILLGPGDLSEEGLPGVANPLQIPALAGLFEFLIVFVPMIGVCVIASAVSLVIRFRRSRGVERLQMKWFASAAAVMATIYGFALGFSFTHAWNMPQTPFWVGVIQQAAGASFFLIPISIGFAILRYRLYDIDLVINKAVVYGALAGFITLVYVGVVVGIGTLVGAGDKPNLGLSLAATAIVAVAFQPVRQRVQRFANRLVYGQRVTPYEAITSFSHRMAESLSFDQVLPKMAEAAAHGVGGVRSQVKLYLPTGGARQVYWPEGDSENHFDKTLRVIHQGEELGEIAVAKAPGEPLTASEDKLLQDLASQAGLALRNLRLTSELEQRLIELQESRKRIVAAQDNERRRMERDIHDGAQQQLVAMAVKLSLAKTLALRDVEKAKQMLDQVKAETEGVVESIRDLARGIFPPMLADQGLGVALESHIQKMSINATLKDETQGARFPQEIEAACYFTIREALQNAAKHAQNQPIAITINASAGNLLFRVRDEGPGFDMGRVHKGSGLENMRDRIEAVGGEFKIRSSPGRGTTVEGRIPVRALEPVR